MNWDSTRLFVFIAYAQKLDLNIHDDVTNGARGLKFGWSLHFIYIHPLGMRAVKALVSLHKCANSPKPLLLDDAIRTKILCATTQKSPESDLGFPPSC